jgi:competence protein ComEC
VGALRDRVARRLIEEGQGGALLAALAVGRRDGLEPARRDAIARTGLGHLLAVSGLHLALVAGLAFALARRSLRMSAWLGARFDTRPMAVLLSWVAASAYALLSGGAAPVQRAWVCLSLPVVALLIERSGRLRVSLSAALLLLLVLDPLALFSPGAQLSFVAAAALGRDIVQGPDRGALVSLVRASATAMVATAPLVALHFAPVAPTALPLNWVAVPWTSFVLLPAALVGAAAAICQCGEGWIAGAASLGELSLAAIDAIAGQLGERPGPGPSAGAIVLSSVMAGATLRAAGTLARLVGCGLVTALLAFAPPGVVEPLPPRLVVLDVGQGDAILVQGTGAAVLIDAGVAGPGGLDRGRDVVLPALRALGVRRLDVVVVTHGDLDHRGGVPSVLAEMPVARLWLTAGARSDPRYAEVVESARRGGVVIEEQGAGSPEELVGDLRLRALWPPADGAGASSNDRSLVLSIAVGGRRVLLPGDLELEGEHGLLALEDDLRADVLLLGHHGSRTSTSVNFLAAVSPSVALVSAPCLGRFAMPHAEVVRRLRARGVPFHWTGRDGALRVALDSELVVSGTGRRRSHCGVPLWNDGL